MAITRRQFVTRLSTLAAAMGMSQVDLAKVTEAFAHDSAWASGGWTNKPKVVWVHGAECTGCSTSLLSLFEDVRGIALEGTSITTLAALDLAVGGNGDGEMVLPGDHVAGGPVDPADHPNAHRTLQNAGLNVDGNMFVANIADVLIDFIDLQYHETVMSMGGDLAYQWLHDLREDGKLGAGAKSAPFVLVVEGAVQPETGGGMWSETGPAPWCSIGMSEDGTEEHKFDGVVYELATHPACAAIIPIGQCATYGGYPACVSPVLNGSQTGAMGTYKFLMSKGGAGELAAKKVVNVPGCPTNPWWFILTVVAWLVDFVNPGTLNIIDGDGNINTSAIDSSRRLKSVYALPLHGSWCVHAQERKNGIYATQPGEAGCLQRIGCKGIQTMTLCGVHGWNSQHPRNNASLEFGLATINGGKGGNCVVAGHPCMACTEEGYPDAFVPFIKR